MANPRSTASIAGHPIHPMLIPFPIAFFTATLACDVAYWVTRNDAWPTAAMWLLGAGIIMAAVAAVVGLVDVVGDRRFAISVMSGGTPAATSSSYSSRSTTGWPAIRKDPLQSCRKDSFCR
jgi:uncharacterized membrane protein